MCIRDSHQTDRLNFHRIRESLTAPLLPLHIQVTGEVESATGNMLSVTIETAAITLLAAVALDRAPLLPEKRGGSAITIHALAINL